MKRFNLLYFLLLLLSFSMIIACNPDEDDPSNTDDPRERFIGNWVCSESSRLNGNSTYSVSINYHPLNSTQVTVANFYHFGADDKAIALASGNTLTIQEQTLCNNLIKGSGTLLNNKINWKYYVNSGADIDTVTAVYSK